MYGRFLACSLAELEANFLLDDLQQWYFRHEMIKQQLARKTTKAAGSKRGRKILKTTGVIAVRLSEAIVQSQKSGSMDGN